MYYLFNVLNIFLWQLLQAIFKLLHLLQLPKSLQFLLNGQTVELNEKQCDQEDHVGFQIPISKLNLVLWQSGK